MRKIQILRTGCSKCKALLENAESACKDLDVEVEKVDDINRILEFGVMMTPALAIDGEVKAVGKVLSEDEIKDILSNNS